MDDTGSTRLPEPECEALFRALFPEGFAGADVLRELAPGGWDGSPLDAVYHPSTDVCFEETLRMHRNMRDLFRKKEDPVPAEPTREEIAREWKPRPCEPGREMAELVGRCLWDVFSDNHEVRTADGVLAGLGSFRASAGFLADVLNAQVGRSSYGYMDFYMGTHMIGGRADLKPVYRMIFGRMKAAGLSWSYSCPRIYLVDFRGLRETLDPSPEPEWAGYSPSEALAAEERDREAEAESAASHAAVDDANRAGWEALLAGPPPDTVQAHLGVYGRFPEGWPPLPPGAE